MCGRFTMTYDQLELLAADLGVPVESLPNTRPRYNIAPTDEHFILREKNETREVLLARWGLVNSWAKDGKRAAAQINARAETIEHAPAFREAFQKRRCVVPSTGFYEWTGPKDARQPLWFHRADNGLVLFAGLYESWMPRNDEWQRTFTIITTTPNGLMEPIHNRMPVVLSAEAAAEWMDARHARPHDLLRLLAPAPDDALVIRAVSPLVNSVKNDDPRLLEEAEAASGPQPSLFAPGDGA
ncbi:MAG: SOS response-associated peptidase [Tepidiformaceae bacterium]